MQPRWPEEPTRQWSPETVFDPTAIDGEVGEFGVVWGAPQAYPVATALMLAVMNTFVQIFPVAIATTLLRGGLVFGHTDGAMPICIFPSISFCHRGVGDVVQLGRMTGSHPL